MEKTKEWWNFHTKKQLQKPYKQIVIKTNMNQIYGWKYLLGVKLKKINLIKYS